MAQLHRHWILVWHRQTVKLFRQRAQQARHLGRCQTAVLGIRPRQCRPSSRERRYIRVNVNRI